mgnify:CR=1 FL=1
MKNLEDMKHNLRACSNHKYINIEKHSYRDGYCVSILRDKENGIAPTAYSEAMPKSKAIKLRDELRCALINLNK